MFFKIFIVACASVFLALPKSGKLLEHRDACLGKDVIPETDKQAMHKYYYCLSLCMMEKLGTMTSDAVYEVDKVLERIPMDTNNYDAVTSKLRECAARSGEDKCATANAVHECLISEMPVDNEADRVISPYAFVALNED